MFPTIQEAEIRDQEAEKRRAWWPPSAEEQSRAGWKASEMDRREDISLVVFRKKAFELEKSYVTKLRCLKEAREKKGGGATTGYGGVGELQHTYLEFRNMWIAIHSCWGGGGLFDNISKLPEFNCITYVRVAS